MAARELNLRSKELLTVSRLRMVKENTEKGGRWDALNVTDKDVAKISGWIEDDAVSPGHVQRPSERDPRAGRTSRQGRARGSGFERRGQELLSIWNEMDRGAMKQEEAFEKPTRPCGSARRQKRI
jgi:hypothetical protein